MNILTRLARALRSSEQRAMPAMELPDTIGARYVDANLAENLSTVFACVTAISTAIASLPAYVYRRADQGREEDQAHSVAKLVQLGPNAWQSWPDFIEWLVAQVLLRGNALAEIRSDAQGRIFELVPIPWNWVSVQLLPSGRLLYLVTMSTGQFGHLGRQRRLLESEVIHIRDRSDDGIVGRSRLSRAGAVVSTGLSVQDFAGSVYRNSANPTGVLTFEKQLGDEARTRLRALWRETFEGPRNAARTLILDNNVKWEAMSVSPEDAELLASRRFAVEELARLFNVPPPLAGDYSHNTFTNAETAGRWFAQFTLTPWIRKIEAAFARSVFSEADRASYELELDMSGFMRGDYAARWQAHKVAVDGGILSRNEVREIEGWNPREGGDDIAPAKPAAPAAPMVGAA